MRMKMTDLRRIAEDEAQPQADRLNAEMILALAAIQKAGLAPVAAATAAPAKIISHQAAGSDVIAVIDVRIGDHGVASGATRDGKPWGNALAWRDLPDGDSQRLKLVAWGEGRVGELAACGAGDIVRIKVREWGVDTNPNNGQQTKTARVGGVQVLQRAVPKPAAPRDEYADFGANRRAADAPPPALGSDGFPAGGDDIPF